MPISADIVIVGDDAGGLTVAALLRRSKPALSITLVPSEHPFYQPGWTLVGAGEFD